MMYFTVITALINYYGQRTLDGTSEKFHYVKDDDDYRALEILRMTRDLNYCVDSLLFAS